MTPDNTGQELHVYDDQDQVANAAAARLVDAILATQGQGKVSHLSLTGGRGGLNTLAAVRNQGRVSEIDWKRVELWWSDERFLPKGDPERNETGAWDALLNHVDLDPARIHPMPDLGGKYGSDVEAAAKGYAAELAAAAESGDCPLFDVSLLGIGEDAHIASLFPGHEQQFAPETVVSISDSPKPPPVRTTFTMRVINNSKQVWLVAFGDGKAEAIKLATSNLPAIEAPAGAARGHDSTVLFCDQLAARLLS